jgi:hypothetical protein
MKSVMRLLILSMVLAGIVKGQTEGAADPLSRLRPYLIGISVPNAQEAALWYEQKLGFKREGSDKAAAALCSSWKIPRASR